MSAKRSPPAHPGFLRFFEMGGRALGGPYGGRATKPSGMTSGQMVAGASSFHTAVATASCTRLPSDRTVQQQHKQPLRWRCLKPWADPRWLIKEPQLVLSLHDRLHGRQRLPTHSESL